MSRITTIIITLCLTLLQTKAETTTIWKGNKTFTSWSDVINIAGSQFEEVEADDIIKLLIQAGEGAQLQISYGNGWTNFEGIEHTSITGNYEMIVKADMVNKLKQGIHIKGINYTLTDVELVKRNKTYTTENDSLFNWNDMLESGCSKGAKCNITFKAYGGCGWHWPKGADFNGVRTIEAIFMEPLSEALIMQIFYDDGYIRRSTITKGNTTKSVIISSISKPITSINFISEKEQTIALESINIKDKNGNVIDTGLDNIRNTTNIKSTIIYDGNGRIQNEIQKGLNIIVTEYKNKKREVKKIYRKTS